MDETTFSHYRLGIEEIDREHLALINLFEQIKISISKDEDVYVSLDTLYDLMAVHFTNEAKYMMDIKFPFIKHHVETHTHILKNIKKMLDEYSEPALKSKYFINNLENGIISHVDYYDRQIADYVKTLNQV